jgi:hypothetical protein
LFCFGNEGNLRRSGSCGRIWKRLILRICRGIFLDILRCLLLIWILISVTVGFMISFRLLFSRIYNLIARIVNIRWCLTLLRLFLLSLYQRIRILKIRSTRIIFVRMSPICYGYFDVFIRVLVFRKFILIRALIWF